MTLAAHLCAWLAVASARGEEAPGPRHALVLGGGLRADSVREDLVVPLTFVFGIGRDQGLLPPVATTLCSIVSDECQGLDEAVSSEDQRKADWVQLLSAQAAREPCFKAHLDHTQGFCELSCI